MQIIRLCQLVGGLPLALELAAPWLLVLTPAEIAQEIEEGFDFLEDGNHDTSHRHHSLRVVFNHSWQLLDERKQTALVRLSVFRYGFGREVAKSVSTASLPLLRQLVECSFLRPEDGQRFSIHETLRQFLSELRQADPALDAETQSAHAVYHGRWLADITPTLGRTIDPAIIANVDKEYHNLEQAWRWATTAQQIDILEQMCAGLFHYYHRKEYWAHGQHRFMETLTAVKHFIEPELQTKLHLMIGRFQFSRGDMVNVKATLDRCLDMLPESPSSMTARVWHLSARVNIWFDETYQMWKHANRALQIARSVDDLTLEGRILRTLGHITRDHRDVGQANDYIQQALAAFHKDNNDYGSLLASADIVWIKLASGELDEALGMCQQLITSYRQMGSKWNASVVSVKAGIMYTRCGAWEQAQEYFEQTMQFTTQIQLAPQRVTALSNLGFLHAQMQEYDAAQQYSRQAIDAAETMKSSYVAGYAWTNLGLALLGSGQMKKSIKAFQKAIDIRQAKKITLLQESRAGLALATLAQGDIVMAQQVVDAILVDLNTHNMRLIEVDDLVGIYLTCFRVLTQMDDPRAEGILQQGYEELQYKAGLIKDEAIRYSLLHNVPSHQALLAAWENGRGKL